MTPPGKLRCVITLGPASEAEAVIRRLMATADRFRLNGSHLDPTSLRTWLERLAALYDDEGRQVPVVLDLQGAKMRIGDYTNAAELPNRFALRLADSSADPAIVTGLAITIVESKTGSTNVHAWSLSTCESSPESSASRAPEMTTTAEPSA